MFHVTITSQLKKNAEFETLWQNAIKKCIYMAFYGIKRFSIGLYNLNNVGYLYPDLDMDQKPN